MKYFFIFFCIYSSITLSSTFNLDTESEAYSACNQAISDDPDLTDFGNSASCVPADDPYPIVFLQVIQNGNTGILHTYNFIDFTPVTECEQGEAIELYRSYLTPGGLVICIGDCSEVISHNGCLYNLDGTSPTPTCTSFETVDSFDVGCYFPATNTGTSTPPNTPDTYPTEPPVDPGSPPSPTNPPASTNQPKNPCLDINGLDICTSPNTETYSINGEEYKISTEPNCGTLNGQRICSNEPQNCGTVNGTYVCAEDTQGSFKTACFTNPTGTRCLSGKQGVKETTDTLTVSNPDGTTTITTTNITNVQGSSPSSTSTVTSADGTSTTSTTTGNPEESIPSNTLSGNGNCSFTPMCNGDPILCAIALNTFTQKCALEDNKNATTQQVTDALGYITTEGEGIDDSITLSTLDMSGFGMTRSCPAPRTYSVLSASFVIDLSPFCSIATIIGNLLLISASFVSIRIFSGT